MSGTVDSQRNQLMSEIFGSSCDKDSDYTGTSNRVHTKSRSSLGKRTHDASVSNCDSGKMLDKSELSQPEHFSCNEQQTFVKSLPLVNADVKKSLTYSDSRCSVGTGSENIDGGDRHEETSSRPGDGPDSSTALLQQREEHIDLYGDPLHLGDGDNGIEGHSGGSLKDYAIDPLVNDHFADPGSKVEQLSRFTDKYTSVDLHRDILNDACHESGIVSAVPLNPISSSGHHSADDSYMSSTRSLVKSPLPSLDLYTKIVCDDVVQQDFSNHEMRSRFSEKQDYIHFLHEKLDSVESSSEKLVQENTVLKKNMSALLRTSQTELQLKASPIVSLRTLNNPAIVNALAKQRKNGTKENPLSGSSNNLSSLISDTSNEYTQLYGESSMSQVFSNTDTDDKRRGMAKNGVEYGDSKVSRDADKSEIQKKRKYEEDSRDDSKKQKVSLSVSDEGRTAKRIVDKHPGSSDPSNRQRQKHHTRSLYIKCLKSNDIVNIQTSVNSLETGIAEDLNTHSHSKMSIPGKQSVNEARLSFDTDSSPLPVIKNNMLINADVKIHVEKNTINLEENKDSHNVFPGYAHHNDKETREVPQQMSDCQNRMDQKTNSKTKDIVITISSESSDDSDTSDSSDKESSNSDKSSSSDEESSNSSSDEEISSSDEESSNSDKSSSSSSDKESSSSSSDEESSSSDEESSSSNEESSQKPVILGYNLSPNDICRDGDNKSNSSRVLTKSIGLQHIQHVKQVDEKTLNVKGDVKAVKQRNRDSNLPLTSLKRKRVTDCDRTTKQSNSAVHLANEVILKGGDHIDEVNHYLISPKKIRMQYTTVYSSSSNNSENKVLKELSSAAETDETNDHGEGAKCFETNEITVHSEDAKCLEMVEINHHGEGAKYLETDEANAHGNGAKCLETNQINDHGNGAKCLKTDQINDHGNGAKCLDIDNPDSSKNESAVTNMESNMLKFDWEHIKQKHSASSAVLSSGNDAESQGGNALDKEQPYVLHKIKNIPQEIKSWKSRLEKFKNSNYSLCETWEYPFFSNVSTHKSVSFNTFENTSVNTFTPQSKQHVFGVNEKSSESYHLTSNEKAILSQTFSAGCDKSCEASGLAVLVDDADSQVDALDTAQPYVLHKIENIPQEIKSWKSRLEKFKNSNYSLCETWEYQFFSNVSAHKSVSFNTFEKTSVNTSTPQSKRHALGVNEKLWESNHLTSNENAILSQSLSAGCDKGSEASGLACPVHYDAECDMGSDALDKKHPYVLHKIENIPLEIKSWKSRLETFKKSNYSLCETWEYPFFSNESAIFSQTFSVECEKGSGASGIAVPVDANNVTQNVDIQNHSDLFKLDHSQETANQSGDVCTPNQMTIPNVSAIIDTKIKHIERYLRDCEVFCRSSDAYFLDSNCGSSLECVKLEEKQFPLKRNSSFANVTYNVDSAVINNCVVENRNIDIDADESVTFLEGCARTRLYIKCLKSNDIVNIQTSVNSLETGITEDLNIHSHSKMSIPGKQSVCEARLSFDTDSSPLPVIKNNMLINADVQIHVEKNTINLEENKDSHNVFPGYAHHNDKETREVPQQMSDYQNLMDQKTNSKSKDMVITISSESSDDSDSSDSSDEESSNSDKSSSSTSDEESSSSTSDEESSSSDEESSNSDKSSSSSSDEESSSSSSDEESSQKPVILGYNLSPNDICRDGDNKRNSSRVLTKSIGLQHIQHVKQVDEKTLNVKGDVKAVKQRNRASNLPLTSLKRKRLTYCDTTTKQSDSVVHLANEVILEGGDHIDEVNHFLISPKKIRMQYTTVYSSSSNNNENKALKELSSAAETDEISDYCEGAKWFVTDETTNHGKDSKCLETDDIKSHGNLMDQNTNSETKDMVFTISSESSEDSDTSDSSDEESSSSDEESSISDDTSSDSNSDVGERNSVYPASSGICNKSQQAVNGSGNSNVLKLFDKLKPLNKLFSSILSNQNRRTKTSKLDVSKVSKTSASNRQIDKTNDSKAKDTTAKIVSDKSYTIDDKDNPVSKVSKTSASNTQINKTKDSKAKDTTEKTVSDKSDTISSKDNAVYSENSIDSLQLHMNNDEEISEDSSLEDGELRSESPDDYIVTKHQTERKLNFESRINLKTSNISASTSGQQRGHSRGTKLSMDLYRPVTGESHSSNQATKAFSTLKGYKIPRKRSLGSQKRPFSDVSSNDRTPKRKRLEKSSNQSVGW